ncbi:hypothetical protein QQF64_029721 [Cirrhinus molitorella]|uniref:TRIM8/14/16/25/29/45/65 coiled-coil region domain-containing protein n=1 Tax=Cirrhinus molitorella TaxID=172907 RepID=A0ABR3N189_9TELE
MNKHKTHDTVTVAEQRTEQEKHLKERLKQHIQEIEKKIQELREAVKYHKRSAQAAIKDSERIFTELICSIERSRSEKSVSHLRKKLEDFCHKEIQIISSRVNSIQIIPFIEPKTREEFLQYRNHFTLDPDTLVY